MVLATLFTSGMPGCAKAQPRSPEVIAREIREAVLTPGNQRPLPVAATFVTGEPNRPGVPTPAFQLSDAGWLKRGYHYLPTFQMPGPDLDTSVPGMLVPPRLPDSYYEAGMSEAMRLGLPLVFYGTQWEVLLLNQPARDANGDRLWDVVDDVRTLLPGTSREAEWFEAGRKWSTSAQMKRLMTMYPAPPRVILISNNEQKRLDWAHFGADRRSLERDPACKAAVESTATPLSDNGAALNCLRRIFSNDWKRLYGKLLQGVREGFRGTAWEPYVRLVGYDAFGPLDVGRYYNWTAYSIPVLAKDGSVESWSPWPSVWDGGIVSLYTHSWAQFLNDFTLASPQTEAMNLPMQLDPIRKQRADYWFEAGIWDGWAPSAWFLGDKRKLLAMNQQQPSPERYGGWIRFVMWMTRPNAVREFREYDMLASEMEPHFKALLDAVEQVWNEPELARFWREGELVRNDAMAHPYQKFHQPEGFPSVARNYLLNTPSHPRVAGNPWFVENPRESGYAYLVPVYAMALRRGGDHLVYAHAPMAPQTGVRIELPTVFSITVDVPTAGRFFIVRDGNVVQQIDRRLAPGELVFSSVEYDTRLSPGRMAIAWNSRGKVDRITWTAAYGARKEGTPIEILPLASTDAGQTNFLIPARSVPYGFGALVRTYRDSEQVGEGWLTLGMASPSLLAIAEEPAGTPGDSSGSGNLPSARPPLQRVKLAPGTPKRIVLYATGTERKSWVMENAEPEQLREVCYANPAPTSVRIGDWSAAIQPPDWIGNAGAGYEQINLWLTDESGRPLDGLPRGEDLAIWLEHVDCQNTLHTSNRLKISIQ